MEIFEKNSINVHLGKSRFHLVLNKNCMRVYPKKILELSNLPIVYHHMEDQSENEDKPFSILNLNTCKDEKKI